MSQSGSSLSMQMFLTALATAFAALCALGATFALVRRREWALLSTLAAAAFVYALARPLAGLDPGRVSVVANLPYNVATPLLLKWLGELDRIERMTLMFQREVALRLAAAPGSRSYGRLSVLAQWLCEVQCVMHLPARAFVPPPKVASSLVQLTPRAQPLAPAERTILEPLVAAAFGQRRKMLRSSLKSFTRTPETLLTAAGIDPTSRAEQIDVTGFCRLARAHAALAAGRSAASR